MSQRRVVITGMGMISPLGNDLASSWDAIANGRSGLGPITSFDASLFTTLCIQPSLKNSHGRRLIDDGAR